MKTMRELTVVALACLAMAMLLAPLAPKARAQDLSKPVFVVATEKLDGDAYARIVALVTPVSNVHIGLVLNKPSEYTMAALFPQQESTRAVKDPVYFGGRENGGYIFALYPSATAPSPHAIEMLPGVWLVPDGISVDAIIEASPNTARYFAGSMSWRAGQLANDIKAGYLIAVPAERDKVFLRDTSGMWESLRKPKGRIES